MMLKLHGFYTQNTMKTLYVLEELGCDYEFAFVDLFKGEHKSEAFSKLTPVGKAPVLQVGDESIFESGAICRYLANKEGSALYPEEFMARAKVDQWMDFFSCHLGRWINTLYFENIIKSKAGMGETDPKVCDEATNFALQQLAIIDGQLERTGYLTGGTLSIADFFAFAYVEQVGPLEFSLDDFPNVENWLGKLESRESIARALQKVAR